MTQPATAVVSRSLLPSHPRRLLAAVLVLPTLAVVACGGGQKTERGAPPPVPVTVGQVVQRDMPLTFHAIGHVEPIETVAVKARIGGALQAVRFTEGDVVGAGDVLFEIDPRPYRAAVAQAEAVLARDQALLTKAKSDVDRYAKLVEQDFVTREQYDQILANAASLEAAVAADQANLDNARLDLGYCTIVAPIAGRTGALSVKVGDLIKANADAAMVTINRTRPIYAAFSVPAQLLPRVAGRTNDGIEVRATPAGDDGPPAEGRLSFVDNAVDTATSTILLKATFPNRDERLWPGQFVDLTVVLTVEPDRVVCPAPAIQTGQEGDYVFVVGSDDTVRQRTVQVERSDERDAVIADGLEAGETVVTDGQLRLVDGATVTVKQAPSGEAAAADAAGGDAS